jgi:predicted transcriptional regulator
MKEAIRQYLDREESKESFKQEALASWQTYQETGQHLTGEEVASWLETWGTDQEKEMRQQQLMGETDGGWLGVSSRSRR